VKPAIILVLAVLFLGRASSAAETPPTPARSAGATPTTPRGATHDPAARPLLSRADLPALKRLDRAQVFAALGSFDERGLSEEEFIGRTCDLLDARRVPGLAAARAAGDVTQALDAVVRACRRGPKPPRTPRVDPASRAAADDALENRFSFYGEKHQLPATLDWDFNPGTGHWGHDLNRFTYLTPLLQSYAATRDARYSRKAIELILDWTSKNDVSQCFRGTPYAFGSYLNNAIHCAAWSHAMATLLASGQVTAIELLRVVKSLHDQLAYLEVVTNGHAGNWPTIGCQGILDTIAALPVLRDTDRLADYCARTLASQVAEQVLPDGVQDELTPHYHRVVVNNLLSAMRALRALGRDLDPQTRQTLRKMVRYQQQTTVPDGSKQVAFNDSDPASAGNLRPALAGLGLQEFLSPPARLGPECFPYAGVAFLRQRQDRGDLYLAFDAGPYGRSHQHEDRLGFWLFAYGRNLLVDPGRHLYDRSARSYYDYLKSTAAHSTLRIDGENQYSAGRRGTWIAKKPLDLGWQESTGEVRAAGVYDLGYGKGNRIAVVHRREIVFVRERCWVVFDVVKGTGEHSIESRFQFAPGTLRLADGTACTGFDDANLLLRTVPTAPFTDIHVERGQENPRGGWYSDSYGQIEPAPALVQSLRARLPWRAATLLFPYQGTTPPKVTLSFDGHRAEMRHPEIGDVSVACSLP
jgi:hypothetical protein